jgi:Bacterial protein of unknown function (DUF899)
VPPFYAAGCDRSDDSGGLYQTLSWDYFAFARYKEEALTRSRDALAAEHRRMPWLAVDKKYEFGGPKVATTA